MILVHENTIIVSLTKWNKCYGANLWFYQDTPNKDEKSFGYACTSDAGLNKKRRFKCLEKLLKK